MATIGQIIYNVEDYNSSGGYISTAKNNIFGTVSSIEYNSFEEYQAEIIDIFSEDQNLTKLYTSEGFLKLGIQAPPGTKIILNDNKQIMIGRTGVYELDEDIKITNLRFNKPKKYVLNVVETAQELSEGKRLLNKAENDRSAELRELDDKYINQEKNEDYWAKYINIQNAYEEKYEEALNRYTLGVNGIYEEDGEEDLYNIIIDFIY